MKKVYVVLQRDKFDEEHNEIVSIKTSEKEAERVANDLQERYHNQYTRYANQVFFDYEEWEIE